MLTAVISAAANDDGRPTYASDDASTYAYDVLTSYDAASTIHAYALRDVDDVIIIRASYAQSKIRVLTRNV